jgi:hypothetical protein
MGKSQRHILVLGVDEETLQAIAPILQRQEFLIHRFDPDPMMLEVVRGSAFDVVIAAYPIPQLPLPDLHAALRDVDSASRNAGFLLVCPPGHIDEAHQYVDHGVNRAVCLSWHPSRFWQAVADLLDVAPRISMRTPVQLDVVLDGVPNRRLCQCCNVSTTGMLLHGEAAYELGSVLEFSLGIPGDPDPIRGRAEVVRYTDVEREPIEGFGVRFTSFSGSDQTRLEGFITHQLDTAEQAFWEEFAELGS